MTEIRYSPFLLLIMSLIGILLIAGILVRPMSVNPTRGNYVVWSIFTILCVLGAVATLFPHHCSSSIEVPSDVDPSRYTIIGGSRIIHGHHPICENYNGYEFYLKGKKICASCLGLFIGALTAILVVTLRFIYNFNFPYIYGYLGLLIIVISLVYVPLSIGRVPVLRTIINTLFVFGFAIVLISVDRLGNIGFDLLTISFCVYWMLTRIKLSHWRHNTICNKCNSQCKIFNV